MVTLIKNYNNNNLELDIQMPRLSGDAKMLIGLGVVISAYCGFMGALVGFDQGSRKEKPFTGMFKGLFCGVTWFLSLPCYAVYKAFQENFTLKIELKRN